MTVPYMVSANAQLVDAAAQILASVSAAYLVFGLIWPRLAMFWARRWNRLWSTAIGVLFVFFFAGMGVYADTGEPGVMIAMAVFLIAAVWRTGLLPAAPAKAVAPPAARR